MANLSFLTLWRNQYPDLPEPLAEYRFHPVRKWRFDWAFVAQRLAVEFDGGQWLSHGGRHNRDGDREKMNAASVAGWSVIHISNQMWNQNPIAVCETIAAALQTRLK